MDDYAAVKEAQEKQDALERDAARYRWLRVRSSIHFQTLVGDFIVSNCLMPDEVDAAFDRAMHSGE